jgi:signal transduction histidine kinase
MRAPLVRTASALRRHPLAADAALAAVLAGAALVSLYGTFELLRQDPSFHEPAKTWIVVSVLATTLPLALRRRLPLAAASTVVAAFIASRLWVAPDVPGLSGWEPYITVWATWLALYSATVHGRPRSRAALAVAVLAAGLFAEVVREIFFADRIFRDLPLNQGFLLAYNAVFIALPVALGAAVRSLLARQRELQREREENARRAVLEERVRIARELHDVVAHHVSLMGIQAGAARRVMERQPDTTRDVLGSIEALSRQAVDELHRLLGFPRREGQSDGLAPQPDLAQRPELVEQARRGPLRVELAVEGEPRPLPPTLELSAYRVIQEALTNAVKHSGATAATVRLRYRPSALDVEVLDDGTRAPVVLRAGGLGLVGMRERVALHGGELRAGKRPQGGFAVLATFPLNGVAG